MRGCFITPPHNARAETSLLVSRGVLKRRERTVPYGNIQSATLRRGPLQRRMGVTAVRIDTAGGSGLNGPHIHDPVHRNATELVRQLIERVEAARASKSQGPGSRTGP